MKVSAGRGKVIVTGGAGFIGSWLCQRLIQEGYEVTCLDNLSSGQRRNLKGLDIKFLQQDITEPLAVELETAYIFHLASRASPVDFEKYPVDILLTNAMGTYHMLELAHKNGARFLLASTSEVYGNPLRHPQVETYWGNVNPNGPRSCYDEAKRFAESLTMTSGRQFGLDVRIARIFNTYGPKMRADDGRVIPNFINQALQGKTITVNGNGTQTRSFGYVSDLVEGLMRLMFTDGLEGEVINLGNPAEVSILEVARLIVDLTGSDSEITFQSLPQDDPERRQPDINKARLLLSWQPEIDLEPGLKTTIEYFRKIQ